MTIITQPETRNKIAMLAGQIASKHPVLAATASKAADIAAGGSIARLSYTRVYIVSTSGKEYRLDYEADAGWRCNCPAYAHRPVVVNGRRYCKHIIAMAIANRARGN